MDEKFYCNLNYNLDLVFVTNFVGHLKHLLAVVRPVRPLLEDVDEGLQQISVKLDHDPILAGLDVGVEAVQLVLVFVQLRHVVVLRVGCHFEVIEVKDNF